MKIGPGHPRRPGVRLDVCAGPGGSRRAPASRAGDATPGTTDADLTPSLWAAIHGLLAEVGRLRAELDRSHRRVGQPKKNGGGKPFVPVLDRPGFIRELSRALSYAQRYGAAGSVAYLELEALQGLDERIGRGAGEAVRDHVVGILADNVRKSDIVARLGGDAFGVLLARADAGVARAKTAALVARLRAEPMCWQGVEIAVCAAGGSYTFDGYEDAAGIFATGDPADEA